MSDGPYTIADVLKMADTFDGLPSHSETRSPLAALTHELCRYFRVAPGRLRASNAKVALGLAVLDVWTCNGSSRSASQLVLDAGHVDAAGLVIVGAVTAVVPSAESDAADVCLEMRARIQQAIVGNDSWEELWRLASTLGEETNFCLVSEANRATRIWQALFNFVAGEEPLLLPSAPLMHAQFVRCVVGRVAATEPPMLADIRESWPKDSPRNDADAILSDKSGNFGAEATLVPVWFGTNRVPLVESDETSGYGNTLDLRRLHYGRCTVRMSRADEARGNLAGFVSTWLRIRPSSGRRSRIESCLRFPDVAAFRRNLAEVLASRPNDARSVLVFVHGYNTTFQAAVRAAADVSLRIKYPGATALFSWASVGRLLGYRRDEEVVEASQQDLAAFLDTLGSVTGFQHIDIAVHSLGNRLLLRTLAGCFGQDDSPAWRLRNLFLGAPDIGQSEYLERAVFYKRAAAKVTMYGSTVDTALQASKVFHRGEVRAGLMPPVAWTREVDAINTRRINDSRLGHNVLLDVPALHADVKQIIDGTADPDERANLMRAGTHSAPYWHFI